MVSSGAAGGCGAQAVAVGVEEAGEARVPGEAEAAAGGLQGEEFVEGGGEDVEEGGAADGDVGDVLGGADHADGHGDGEEEGGDGPAFLDGDGVAFVQEERRGRAIQAGLRDGRAAGEFDAQREGGGGAAPLGAHGIAGGCAAAARVGVE